LGAEAAPRYELKSLLKRRRSMLTQLSIMIALIAALAAGSSAPATTTNATKPPNPVQHSE
jgi:hypothetical protein